MHKSYKGVISLPMRHIPIKQSTSLKYYVRQRISDQELVCIVLLILWSHITDSVCYACHTHTILDSYCERLEQMCCCFVNVSVLSHSWQSGHGLYSEDWKMLGVVDGLRLMINSPSFLSMTCVL